MHLSGTCFWYEVVWGLYKGLVSNLGQTAVKAAYRGPLMVKVPQQVENMLSGSINNYSLMSNIIAAGIIGYVDALITTPWEWSKVRRITSQNQWSFREEVKQNSLTTVIPESYKAFHSIALKEVTAWALFFMMDDMMKSSLRQINQGQDHIPAWQLMMGSLVSAGVKIIATNPIDVAKTTLQKENPLQINGVFNTIKHIAEQQGVLALMRGGVPRYIQAVLAISAGSLIREWSTIREQEPVSPPKDSHVGRLIEERVNVTDIEKGKLR